MSELGVNIDHVATLRQARREFEPDPLSAALICQRLGVKSIVVHLREDRRHINDRDVRQIREKIKCRMNLEMSVNPEIVNIACRIKPHQSTLVPEKRQEITTEGGLNVSAHFVRVKRTTAKLQKQGITVSLFIDPAKKQIKKAKETGAEAIELHTGRYARAKTKSEQNKELKKLKTAATYGQSLGLVVHAGHGLNYQNTRSVARIKEIEELNIGHSIVARSVFVGLKRAVQEMLKLVKS